MGPPLTVLQSYYESIETRLRDLVQGPALLQSALARAVMRSGKRLRPIFALLSCEAVCGDYRPALPIAVAYELAHNASLVQDDIIDRSGKRRDVLSVYSEFGLNTAILTSDLLIFEIFRLLAAYRHLKLSKSRLCLLLEEVAVSARQTAVGEYLDLELTRGDVTDEAQYLDLVRNKTGAIVAGSAACGAIAGGAGPKTVAQFRRFGENMGVAYQVRDDLLDVIGDEAEMGKPSFVDVRNRNQNIVVLYTLQNASDAERQFVRSLLGKQWFIPEEVERARQIFQRCGAVRYAERLAARLIETGRRDLLRRPKTPGIEKLLTFWASATHVPADSEGPILRSA